MAKTPLLLITDAGEAAAMRANPKGPFVNIVGARIGSAYGYTPTREDTNINGNLLATLNAITYDNVGDNTLRIQFQIPPDTGPFDFGEIGIFVTDTPNDPSNQNNWYMFGKAVFDKPQTKYSSLGTNVGSTFTFNVLIKLQQSIAIFKILNAEYYPSILDVACWSDVIPFNQSANQDVKALRVAEWNVAHDVSFLNAVTNPAESQFWSVNSNTYHRYRSIKAGGNGFFPVAQASATYIDIDQNLLHPADLTTVNRQFLIRTDKGYFRSVNRVAQQGNNYRFFLNVTNDGQFANTPLPEIPTVGSKVTIYRDDQAGGTVYYDEIVDPPPPPPPPPLANWGQPGLATAGDGMALSAAGFVATYGLLHEPSQNTGRTLDVDLNNTNLPSGLYTIAPWVAQPGNCPVNGVAAHLHQVAPQRHPNGMINQYFVPIGQGPGGLPVFWRTFDGSNWTAWRSFFDPKGNQGRISVATPGLAQNALTITIPDAGNWMVTAWYSVFQSQQTPITLTINGNQVAYLPDEGDPEGISYTPIFGSLQIGTGGPADIPVLATTRNVWDARAQCIMAMAVRM